MADMVSMVECLSWDAGHRIDLSDGRCFGVPGSRCLLRHLALRIQQLVILKDLTTSIHRLSAKQSMLTFERRLRTSADICAGGEQGRQGAQLAAAVVDCHSEILLLPFLLFVLIITL